MNLLIEKGVVKIGDYILPGALLSLSVGGAIIIDSEETQNKEQRKVFRGFEDKTISITLQLFNDENLILTEGEKTAYEYLQEIEEIFSKTDKGIPKTYKILSNHTQARKINEVIFSRLESEENNENDTILVTIEFVEFVPAKLNSSKENPATTNNKTNNQSSNKTKDVKNSPVEEEPALKFWENAVKGFKGGEKYIRELKFRGN